MEKQNYLSAFGRPTLLQIRYMEELDGLSKKYGVVSEVARRCQVNHAAVSRFLKKCREEGYLDSEYNLTKMGTLWLNKYVAIREGLFTCFLQMHLTEAEAWENVRMMIESMDLYALNLLLQRLNRTGQGPAAEPLEYRQDLNPSASLEHGNFSIDFRVFRFECKAGKRRSLSMADQGFEKPGLLHSGVRSTYLELTLREIRAHSRLTGILLSGHLSSLKYMLGQQLVRAEIRNGKVRIPFEAVQFHMREESRFCGTIPITVTCSVGRVHMPESKALLIFWA
ncbi:MAG: hypothetical protein SOR89_05225 [Ndongobacter sp.]|nr:hypothetical protein [Ndongobacter sp.]